MIGCSGWRWRHGLQWPGLGGKRQRRYQQMSHPLQWQSGGFKLLTGTWKYKQFTHTDAADSHPHRDRPPQRLLLFTTLFYIIIIIATFFLHFTQRLLLFTTLFYILLLLFCCCCCFFSSSFFLSTFHSNAFTFYILLHIITIFFPFSLYISLKGFYFLLHSSTYYSYLFLSLHFTQRLLLFNTFFYILLLSFFPSLSTFPSKAFTFYYTLLHIIPTFFFLYILLKGFYFLLHSSTYYYYLFSSIFRSKLLLLLLLFFTTLFYILLLSFFYISLHIYMTTFFLSFLPHVTTVLVCVSITVSFLIVNAHLTPKS